MEGSVEGDDAEQDDADEEADEREGASMRGAGRMGKAKWLLAAETEQAMRDWSTP